MDMFNFFAGGAAIGVIMSCWSYIKGIFWRVISFVVQRVEMPDSVIDGVILRYLLENYKRSRIYDHIYQGSWEFLRRNDRKAVVPYECFGRQLMLFWVGWFPMFVHQSKGKSKSDHNRGPHVPAETGESNSITSLVFLYVRGTVDIENIIDKACKSYSERLWTNSELLESSHKRFFIKYVPDINRNSKTGGSNPSDELQAGLPWYESFGVRLVGYEASELGHQRQTARSALDSLIFPENVTHMIDEIKLWRASREWYIKRGIPWKRGWLLYGPPGTGKTALARAFAEDLDMPIFVYSLGELSNPAFMREWINMQSFSPCIALVEDIDNVFHGRKNVSQAQMGFNFFPMRPRRMRNSDDADPFTNNAPGFSVRDRKKDEDDYDYTSGGILTFDCFLNMLDGIERGDGIFTVITTNDVSKIDVALGQPHKLDDGTVEFISSRPGRIDRAIELMHMTKADKCKLAERILADFPGVCKELQQQVQQEDREETPAQFQERCANLALHHFWRKSKENGSLITRN